MSEPTDALARFFERVEAALAEQRFDKLLLSGARSAQSDLLRLSVRAIPLRGQPSLSLVYHHAQRDITKNHAPAEALLLLHELAGTVFANVHLHAGGEVLQLARSRKGRYTLRREAGAESVPAPAAHNRDKQRALGLDRPFLHALGVTDAQQRLVPAMARKWKQINKFLEVFDAALQASPLREQQRLDVLDFGSGKAYLSFALHDHLRNALGRDAQVTGIEQRADMVQLCGKIVDRLGLQGIHFELGDVSQRAPQQHDVMIALHACDTATDHAMAAGIRGGASIILCAPCCHKQLRPQLLSPEPMRPILQHGVHLGQQAEMLTDGLRAMLLEACGYATQVFEFVSLEHTAKNKMVLAVKRAAPAARDGLLAQLHDVKALYGIREQCLETLLRERALI